MPLLSSIRPYLLPIGLVLLLLVGAAAVRLAPASVAGAPERSPALQNAIFFGLLGAGVTVFGLVALRAYLAGDIRLPVDYRSGIAPPTAVAAVSGASDFPSRLAAVKRATASAFLSASSTFSPAPIPALSSAPF